MTKQILKKTFEIGQIITLDDCNKLKNKYFDMACEESFGKNKNYGVKGGHLKYERLKKKYKKEIILKIVELP